MSKVKTGLWRHNFSSTEENRKARVAEKAIFLFSQSRPPDHATFTTATLGWKYEYLAGDI